MSFLTSADLRWAVDGRGQVTSDPREAMREGAGLPLGGQEETGGYKGYGLALMVEVLCGVMSGHKTKTTINVTQSWTVLTMLSPRRHLGPAHPPVGPL